MNKKTYISPELVIEDIELETMLQSVSNIDVSDKEIDNHDLDEDGY